MKRYCASCGRPLPAGDARTTGVIYSSWTKAAYCGPKQGLDKCRARARRNARRAA